MEIFGVNISLGMFVLIFILFDIITGIAKAFATGTFTSSAMREGIWHKVGTIIILALAALCNAAGTFIPDLPAELSVVYVPVCIYIIVMELASIIENAIEINPELDRFKIFSLFGREKEEEENAEDE